MIELLVVLIVLVILRSFCNSVRVPHSYQCVVYNHRTGLKRILHQDYYHDLGFFETIVEFNWISKESEPQLEKLQCCTLIPIHPIPSIPLLITTRLKCNTEVKVECTVGLQIVDPLKMVDNVSSVHMFSVVHSAAANVISEYEYDSLHAMKTAIEKQITDSISKDMEYIGIVCIAFIIKSILPVG